MSVSVAPSDKAPLVHITPRKDPTRRMKALIWQGKKDIQLVETSVPLITDPQDVILKVTATAICGSDLHLYLNTMSGMTKGAQMGHEFMGIVESVGPEVKTVKKGDRVIAAFDIACGQCKFCGRQQFSCCDNTNNSEQEQALFGDRTAGFFGYSHLTGGWDGGQAEFARVPFADVNLLKVPSSLSDEKVLFLSDILPTAWHATEMGEVSKGDVVAIWGAGPVGILAAHCSFARGAQRVILIDNQAYRLEHAEKKLPGLETINFDEKKTVEALRELVPLGPDVCIEAVGLHYAKSLTHKLEMALQLENDPADMLNEMITGVSKGGRISIVGVYSGFTNHFNIGALMERSITMRGGQTPCQKYWKDLLKMIEDGVLDPTIVLTHQLPLEEGPRGYKIFNDKVDGCIKVVLRPGMEVSKA